jgi:hypothetical protein
MSVLLGWESEMPAKELEKINDMMKSSGILLLMEKYRVLIWSMIMPIASLSI